MMEEEGWQNTFNSFPCSLGLSQASCRIHLLLGKLFFVGFLVWCSFFSAS